MRLLYIDKFDPALSNFYWLKWFQRALGEENVFNHEMRMGGFEDVIRLYSPDHVHLGGSVKNFLVPIELIKELKQRNIRVSAYYGDAAYTDYHEALASYVDFIGFSTDTYPKEINAKTGRNVCHYMNPPTDPEIFKPYKLPKIYDLIFIGNRYGGIATDRNTIIEKVRNKYNLSIFGNNWGDDNKAVYGKEFAKVCSQAKIAIDVLVRPYAKELRYYFSNRPINTIACACFYIIPYTPGLEDLFEDGKHLCWYETYEELFYWIDFYLEHDKLREKIAKQGRKYVIENFTYEINVKRFLSE
jgi:spore maturation protein CgeB